MRQFARLAAALLTIAGPLLGAAGPIPVRVTVRTPAGQLVRNAYIALVPPWRPWSRPVAETIAEGGTVIFSVPAASYRVVASGTDYATNAIGPITPSSKSQSDVTISLKPLRLVKGVVSDRSGNPVEGARVSIAYAVIPPPLSKFSVLAVKSFASGWATTSGKDGMWQLRVPDDAAIPLVVQKNGFAAGWHLFRPSDPLPIDTFLARGASLHLTLDRADPSLTVTLKRRAPTPSTNSMPPGWEIGVDARRPYTTSVEWQTLSPGTYDILSKYDDPQKFGGPAKTLGSVTVAEGESRNITATLPAPAKLHANAVDVFVPKISADDLADAQFFGTAANGVPEKVGLSLEDTTGGALVLLDAGAVRAPFYGVTSDRFLSCAAGVPPKGVPVEAVVFLRADVNLHIRSAENGIPLPRAGMAALSGCPTDRRVALPVETLKDGLVHFPVPAGCRATTIAFAPFEPVVSSVSPAAATVRFLGDFLLHAAGSADVHVVRTPGDSPIAGANVQIAVLSADGKPVEIAREPTSPDGWAHFTGVSPRRKLTVVARTADGDVSAAAHTSVEPGERATVDPLPIPSPTTLVIEPKLDSDFTRQFDDAAIEEIRAMPLDPERSGGTRIAKIDGRASVKLERLTPGRWHLLAVVSIGGAGYPFDLDDVDLTAGETRHITRVIRPLVFNGRVVAHGKGVAVKVDISGPRTTPSSIIRSVNSTSDGAFQIILPEKGLYEVNVRRLTDQEVFIPIGEVAFDDPSTPVTVPFPDGSATVHVTAQGQPVSGAIVTAVLRRDAADGFESLDTANQTDDNGTTRFEALPAGTWTVTASTNTPNRSAEKSVTIRAAGASDVDLDLADGARFSGIIRNAAGAPAAGASIQCIIAKPGQIPETAFTRTNESGEFDIDTTLPPPPAAQCGAAAPSGDVLAFRLTAGNRAEIVDSGITGALTIDWAGAAAPLWLVNEDGGAVDLSRWMARSGTSHSVTLSALAPGRWRVARISSLADWVALGNGGPATRPAEVSLQAGEQKSIQIDPNPLAMGAIH